jgi:uncharacterized protein (DUF58 family)
VTRTRDAILLGALLVLVALAFDAPALDVPGVALVLLGVVCELWVRAAARDLTVERELARTRAVEEEPVDVGVLIRSPAIGAPSGELDDPFLDGRTALLRPGRRAQRIRIRASFARRGRRRLGAPAVIVRDPLGMTRRSVTGGRADELLILPRTEPLTDAARGDGQRPGPWLRTLSLAADVDLDGLRPYRPGTSASRIYWPGLARGGDLSERRLRSGSDERALVVLDTRTSNPADLDAAVRAAASICRHLGEGRGCRLGLPGMRRALEIGPGLRGWEAAHTHLALVERGGRPSATALAQRRGLLIWVSAERLTRAPDALVHSGAGTRLLVVPGTLAAGRPAFAVAGCTAYLLGAGRRPVAAVAAAGATR